MTASKSKKIFAFIVAMLVSTLFVALPLSGCKPKATTYYTVTFDANGGSSVESMRVKSGGLVTRPTAPTREKCTFKDWYKDREFEAVWNFKKDKVTSDIILYAAWNNMDGTPAENEFETPPPDDNNGDNNNDNNNGDNNNEQEPATGKVTATFNVGRAARLHGLSNPKPQVVESGSKITKPSVSLSGYSVTWKKEGRTVWNFDTDKLTNDTTFYAEWSDGSSSTPVTSYTPSSSLQSSDTVYIHYYRPDGNYNDWSLYAWKDSKNTTIRNSTKDNSGAVFAVSFSSIGLSASNGALKFIVAQIPASGDWFKDGGDNEVNLSSMQKLGSSYHWYVSSGNVSRGKNSFTPQSASSSNLSETLSSTAQTESPRASKTNVNRSTAAALSPAKTVTGWDETGVGYQIFVASFCDSDGDGWGDLNGITSKLDYLHDDLNVDVLWLTPVQKSNSNHGYDCYDYYSINDNFGTDYDYRNLVYQAHKRGMKIIMDLVVNHTSPQNEWFIKSKAGVIETVTYQDGTTAKVNYRDFYRWKSGDGGGRWISAGGGWSFYSSFGGNMPELNYDYQPVRDAMLDVASYWMAYGLDGFRMDAVKHIFMWDESENAGDDKSSGDGSYKVNETKNVEFFKEFDNKLKAKYPNCFLLGEQWNGDPNAVAPFYAGMDSLFDFNTYYDLPRAIKGTEGKNASTEATQLKNNAKLYDEKRGTGNHAINSMMSSNHDIDRLNTIMTDNTEQSKLYISVIMTMPGVSWIYHGDEIGLKDNGGGDEAHRQSMKWDSSYSEKCTVIGYGGTNGAVKSVAEQKTNNSSLLKHVMGITKVRNDYPALISGQATCSAENGVLKIVATKSGQKTVTVYHNFTNSAKTVAASGMQVFGSGSSIGAYGTAVFIN